MAGPATQYPEKSASPFDSPRYKIRERAYLEDFIIEINLSGRAWLKRQGRVYGAIPQKRVKELAKVLQAQAMRDRAFFYSRWLPIVASESVFVNAINDMHLPPHRRSVGYAGVQVQTVGKPADYLLDNWEWAMEAGYNIAKDMDAHTAGPLETMSCYRTGLAGYRKGRRAITDWMRACQGMSLGLFKDLAQYAEL